MWSASVQYLTTMLVHDKQHLADRRVALALPEDGQPLALARREGWQGPRVCVPLCLHLCMTDMH